uniref:Uncharacterized protein n=1 Tax=Rhizophora mucronata TaxID=61149 RepID=A0A2P2MBS9_RHIMU
MVARPPRNNKSQINALTDNNFNTQQQVC